MSSYPSSSASSSAERVRIRLEPLSVEFEVPRGGALVAGLAAHGVEFPCGGMGECGGCQVRVLSGALPVTEADATILTPEEIAKGWRLACRARAEESLVLECGQWHMQILAGNQADAPSFPAVLSWESVRDHAHKRHAIAIDLGTTTIAAQLIDAASGDVLAVETALNPQAAFGSDVMSRIRAVLDGQDPTTPIRAVLGEVIARLAGGRVPQIAEVLLVGNTVMHHLFCGLDVEPLAHAPFVSPSLGEQRFTARELGWELPADCIVRFAHCIGGFVGSDILAGIVAAGVGRGDELTALVDLGTNGEIAIGNRHGIVCASTAAGPAFEAGAIRMGMRAVTGAIAYVAVADGALRPTVIDDAAPRGICGSGLVDAVAAGLRTGAILSNGRIADTTKVFPIAPPVVLYQSDIRELQLAKGAIAAGFRLLIKRLAKTDEKGTGMKGTGFSLYSDPMEGNEGTLAPEGQTLRAIHLAGAFGNYVQIESARRIGLLEAPHAIIHAAGNTALRGAKMLLLGGEPVLPPIKHVSLAADPEFQDEFAACMSFPASL
jgi:uncharacterized 2Fe-2S/4Fe-4S cluster protein (DUF4445 family)